MDVCHGRRRCTVTADSATFGNPCRSDSRVYLKVVYTCSKYQAPARLRHTQKNYFRIFNFGFQFHEKCSRIFSIIPSSRTNQRMSIPTSTRMTCTTRTSFTGNQKPFHRHRSCTGNCQSPCPDWLIFRPSSQR